MHRCFKFGFPFDSDAPLTRPLVRQMDETLWHKFNQHADLQAELLATGNAILIEVCAMSCSSASCCWGAEGEHALTNTTLLLQDSDKDSFWGVGADRKGKNELGKALERLRSRLRGSEEMNVNGAA